MKKTLFYIELPPPHHGMTYVNDIIYSGLREEENCDFHLLDYSTSLSEIGTFGFRKIFLNFKVALKAWKGFFRSRPQQVYSIVSATRFGIIRDFLMLAPAVLTGKKRILHLHGFTYYKIFSKSSLYRAFFKILAAKSTIIVLCNTQKKKTAEELGLDSSVLHNPLNKEIRAVSKKLQHDSVKLLFISNISKPKGAFDLLNSIKNIDNVSLTVAGSFLSDKGEFEALLSEMKEKVSFLGFADESRKEELLSTHDVFCLPSRLEEGSPISIIEAMAYGLPVIASDKGCIREMIANCGYVANEPMNKDKMADALAQIMKNYETYSENAVKNYKTLYSKDIFIQNLKGILK